MTAQKDKEKKKQDQGPSFFFICELTDLFRENMERPGS